MSAELAARRTAAAAVLGDFRRAVDEFIDDGTRTVPRPDYSMWAFRLASEVLSLLQRRETEDAEPGPAAQLAEIRLVFDAFDWETDDRQYALEQIEQIVNGDGR